MNHLFSRALSVLILMTMAVLGFAQGYTPRSILPSLGDLDEALVSFYRQWKSVYLAKGYGGAYVNVVGDHKPMYGGAAESTITVSEAHGYGMLILAMMADFDPDARTLFDDMVRFFLDHPARSSPALMAWNQVAGGQDAQTDSVDGMTTATDGDLDIAYALLLAHQNWGSQGMLNYQGLAQETIAAILTHEIDSESWFVLIGDWAAQDESNYAGTTRSSDFMLSHFRAFADATGDRRWLAVRDRAYSIINIIQKRFSPATGLMPDFIVNLPQDPRPAPPMFLEGMFDGDYSWNATRFSWRVTLDYLLYGEPRALAAVRPINRWIQRQTNGDPSHVAGTYHLDGSAVPDQGAGTMAFVAPLAVAAMVEPANQAWLDACWKTITDTPIGDEDYFGNTLKLLAMITLSGHWDKFSGQIRPERAILHGKDRLYD